MKEFVTNQNEEDRHGGHSNPLSTAGEHTQFWMVQVATREGTEFGGALSATRI